MIKDINAQKGVTVILTTHDMKDVDEICQRIILIDKGRIIIDGPTCDVKKRFKGNSTIRVVFDKAPDALDIERAADVELKEDGSAVITFDSALVSSAAIISGIVAKYKIVDITIKEADIDDIIRNLYNSEDPVSAVH
jgi:ABC-2 type transport system ATP-binding protein